MLRDHEVQYIDDNTSDHTVLNQHYDVFTEDTGFRIASYKLGFDDMPNHLVPPDEKILNPIWRF